MVRYDASSVRRGSKYFRDRRGSGGASFGGGKKAAGGAGGILMIVLALIFGPDALGDNSVNIAANTPAGESEQEASQEAEANNSAEDDPETAYMKFLIGDTNETWERIFEENNQTYQPTYLNVFSENITTNGCGSASSAVGPFYCPAPNDQTVYIDLDFYDELSTRFGAPGDFAQAYVIAHEVGHHIQSITGQSEAVRARQQNLSTQEKNKLSVALELQADCYAGVWAHSANERTIDTGEPILEVGDLEEGLAAAEAVGDNRIQESMGQDPNPHTWTHGSDKQRKEAFEKGFDTGSMQACGSLR